MPSEVSTAGTAQDLSRVIEELKLELHGKNQELAEAREQQVATAQILASISNSPTDAQRTFHDIAAKAARLCDAYNAGIFQLVGDHLRVVAHCGPIPTVGPVGEGRVPLTRGAVVARAVLDREPVHVADVQAETDELPLGSEVARRLGYRTQLAVPLIREGKAIGVISIQRADVRPFTDRQIELLKTFADQAVIAIENTRLFEEVQQKNQALTDSNAQLTEALEQQTATSEILRVISSSPSDIRPVLDAVGENAARLCDANNAVVYKLDGGLLRQMASYGGLPTTSHPAAGLPVDRDRVTGRAVFDRRTIHVHNLATEDAEFPQGSKDARRDGHRTTLATPLLREGVPLGAILIRRMEVRPFSERQIKLLETFADQAAIAIENTRLFEEVQARTRELQEALEYQTATSEVLAVIGRSPSELQPVLDTIVATAARLCEAEFALVYRLKEDGLYHVAAANNADAAFVKHTAEHPVAPDRGSALGRAALERKPAHFPDCLADPEFTFHDYQRIGKQRSLLGVPLLRHGVAIGAMTLARTVVKPYSDRQIELVSTFADQAVIAIENARLFEEVQARTKELQESLEYQTATSDVLDVISRSRFELQPVFDTIVETAARLCHVDYGVVCRLADDGKYHLAGNHGYTREFQHYVEHHPFEAGHGTVIGRAALEGRTIHVPDVLADPEYTYHEGQKLAGYRSLLGVPLLRDGKAIGVLALHDDAPEPFTDKQIGLVETFADQAIIAIENARLFEEVQSRTREVSEALEYQTATSEVLGVISRSPTDVQPVFDTIAANALRLCGATWSAVTRFDGELMHLVSLHNLRDPAGLEAVRRAFPRVPSPGGVTDRATLTGAIAHIPDVREDPEYQHQAMAQAAGYRSHLSVPMLREGRSVGAITVAGASPGAFAERQVNLLKAFADQAVIAINNARLFEEVQARTRELSRSVEELRSLGEVGRTVSSTLEVSTVLKTVLEQACAMAQASGGAIYVFDKARGEFHLEAAHNMSAEHIARVRAHPIKLGETVVGECGQRREAVQMADLDAVPSSPLMTILRRAGVRALLAVPLLHQDEVIGALVVRRSQPGAFSPEIVRLLEAFAAQSAIAVHNARLFHEIEEKGRQLEIASQHKSQFVANMSHELRTPLAAMLGYAELLKEGIYGALPEKATPIIERVQSNGKHLLGLINTVLDISKIESGQFKLNLGEYALSSMVETVKIATELLAASKKLVLKTEVARGLPYGLGDEQRLTQVLLNLVGNAIKFTDQGEVRIDADAVNGHFALSVSDTGPGIPPDERNKIFEKFHQIDNSNTRTKGGTGLGLAIAKEIVEMHGGRIWVESIVGRGSTFRLELPVRAAAEDSGS